MPCTRATKSKDGKAPCIPCTDCVKTFTRGADLRRHMLTVHNPDIGLLEKPCPHAGCLYKTHNKKNMEVHKEARHDKDRFYLCRIPDCSNIYTSASARCHHESKAHGVSRRAIRNTDLHHDSDENVNEADDERIPLPVRGGGRAKSERSLSSVSDILGPPVLNAPLAPTLATGESADSFTPAASTSSASDSSCDPATPTSFCSFSTDEYAHYSSRASTPYEFSTAGMTPTFEPSMPLYPFCGRGFTESGALVDPSFFGVYAPSPSTSHSSPSALTPVDLTVPPGLLIHGSLWNPSGYPTLGEASPRPDAQFTNANQLGLDFSFVPTQPMMEGVPTPSDEVMCSGFPGEEQWAKFLYTSAFVQEQAQF